MTLARQRVLSSSEVRASDLEHGGLWVRIPSGVQIFCVSSYGWFFTSPFISFIKSHSATNFSRLWGCLSSKETKSSLNFIQLLRYYSLSNVWIDQPLMPSSDITTPWPLLKFMQKVKHDFQVVNREISFGNVCMIQNRFIFFDRNSCLTFKLSTACSTTLNRLYWNL